MGATEEQMVLIDRSKLDHVSYILILFSIAFLVFTFSNMLVHLYDRLVNPPEIKGFGNGRIVEEGRVRDAEEFELDGLMSDDEADEGRRMLRRSEDDDQGTPSSPSTVGKNNQRRAP